MRNNRDGIFCAVRAEGGRSGGGVWFSKTVIITVLKSVGGKRLLKTKDFCVSCDYSDNWSVWFTGTVIVGCGGDP
jgi:hypothetical protein